MKQQQTTLSAAVRKVCTREAASSKPEKNPPCFYGASWARQKIKQLVYIAGDTLDQNAEGRSAEYKIAKPGPG